MRKVLTNINIVLLFFFDLYLYRINKCKVRFGFTYTTDVWGYNATGRDSQPISSTTVNQYGTFASTVNNYVVGKDLTQQNIGFD